jgi:hypothetical protein
MGLINIMCKIGYVKIDILSNDTQLNSQLNSKAFENCYLT